MESVLRPRDIQARIRAGEAPEDVAAAAQTSVDRIMGYATPVLAERAYQAELAQRASVRRRAATGPVSNLGGAVSAHLETIDVDPESVQWDSWRREDGRWTVTASYVERGDERLAQFAYDAAGRFVVAEDDEARVLVGERPPAAPDVAPPGAAQPVAEDDDAAQLPIGDDALDVVMGFSARTAPAATPAKVDEEDEVTDEVTIDLTDTSRAVRGSTPPRRGDADWMSTQASDRPAPVRDTVEPDAPQPDGAPQSDPWDSPDDDETVEGDAREEEQEEAEALFEVVPSSLAAATGSESSTPSSGDRPARATRPKRRASVPSWDEIMFGSPSGSD